MSRRLEEEKMSTAEEKEPDQEDCEAFGATGRVVLRHCGVPGARHALCGGCFMAWFIQRGESTCPVCRADYEAHFKPV